MSLTYSTQPQTETQTQNDSKLALIWLTGSVCGAVNCALRRAQGSTEPRIGMDCVRTSMHAT